MGGGRQSRWRWVWFALAGLLATLIQVALQPGVSDIFTGGAGTSLLVSEALDHAASNPVFLAWSLWYLVLASSVHAGLIALIYTVAHNLAARRPLRQARRTGLTAATTAVLGLIIINKALFPASQAVPLLFPIDANVAVSVLLSIGVGLFVRWLLTAASPGWRMALAVVATLAWLPHWWPVVTTAQASDQAPNVVLIGIDSLRSDQVEADASASSDAIMPGLSRWLATSVRFDNAVTPLPQTNAALTSLITARYPAHNGIRGNLFPDRARDFTWTLGGALSQRGYQTMLAMDGTRFAAFDHADGFDRIVSPPSGVANFLLGDLVDTIGTNLLSMTPIAAWLDPYGYGNRDAHGSYRPAQFTDRIIQALREQPAHGLMLMVHLCVGHYPYLKPALWRETPPARAGARMPAYYRRGLRGADVQFSRLLRALRASGVLDNAVMAVYSDHGEELGTAADRGFRRANGITRVAWGHGSSALVPAQNRIVLAVQRYVDAKPQCGPATSSRPALLTDLAPTVLGLLNADVHVPDDADGRDLLDADDPVAWNRVRYIENAYTAPATQAEAADHQTMLDKYGHWYRIDGMSIHYNVSASSPSQKQRAALVNGRMVALGPSPALESACRNGSRAKRYVIDWPNIAPDSLATAPVDEGTLWHDLTVFFQVHPPSCPPSFRR